VGGAFNRDLGASARDEVDEGLARAGVGEDGVLVGEGHEGGLVPARELVGHGSHLGGAGVVVGGGDEQGELGGARFGLGRRERGLVGGHHVFGQLARGGPLDHEAHRQVGVALGEVAPGHEALAHAAGEESGVEDHEPLHAVGVLDRPAQADRPAPVLHHHRRVAHVDRVVSARDQLDVAVVAVPAPVGGLVGASEARVVDAQHPPTRLRERRDHLAVEVGPGRLAVEAHHRLAFPHIEGVETQPVRLHPARLVAPTGEVDEALVGGAEDLHEPKPLLGIGLDRGQLR
jgi:hypothetical protein